MEQFKVIAAFYILSLTVALGFATSAAIVFPEHCRYAYGAALFLQSLLVAYVYVKAAGIEGGKS
jgi:hypothetical protein